MTHRTCAGLQNGRVTIVLRRKTLKIGLPYGKKVEIQALRRPTEGLGVLVGGR